MRELDLYLDCLFGAEPASGLIEIRYRLTGGRGGMGQMFIPCEDARRLALPRILLDGRTTDVYVGVAPRRRPRGGRDAIDNVHALWADLDTPEALEALRRYRPLPSMVIRSGSGGAHAYWSLWPPVTPDQAEQANRRMAAHLGADMRATDAARILRPPGTLNHKHKPPRPVEAVYVQAHVHELEHVVSNLPGPELEPVTRRPVNGRAAALLAADDPLRAVPPAVYVEALTGRPVRRDGKVRCPFHAGGEERTPSLHVYPDHWYCFGCESGGSIIDLGARLYNLEPRGDGYRQIRARLERDLRGAV